MGLTSRDKRDAYYRLAKAHGYRARAAFKLIQMEDTLSLLKNATRVVDLCAAPGGWTQVVVERCAAAVVAVDLKDIAPGRRGDHIGGGPDLAVGDRAHRFYLGRQGGRRIVRRRAGRAGPRRRRRAPPAVAMSGGPGVRAQGARTGRELRLQDIPGPRRGGVLRRAPARVRRRALRGPRCSRHASVEAYAVGRGFGRASDATGPVPFVACGGADAFDADASYALEEDCVYRDPVQAPLRPPHLVGVPTPPPAPTARRAAPAVAARWLGRLGGWVGGVVFACEGAPPPASDAGGLGAWFLRRRST